MSSPAPWNDIRARIDAANLGVPIAYPNEYFQTPSPPSLWMSVEATGDVLDPIELGANVWAEEGSAYCHIFAPAGQGTDDARALAKTVANLFRGLGPQPVVYHGASIGLGSAEDIEGAWWRLSVRVDFQYQDISG